MPATLPPIDIAAGEKLEPVASIAEDVTGYRPHPTTIVRWTAGKGAASIKLPSIIVGRRRMTTKSAYVAWLQAVNDARNAKS